ncbi:membrane protein implicated in regulation of membrane protease activity [Glaciihabitans sp. UYNi722]
MHPARLVAFIFLMLCLAAILAGLIYGAITPSPEDLLGGWTILAVATMFAVLSFIALIIWRRSR